MLTKFVTIILYHNYKYEPDHNSALNIPRQLRSEYKAKLTLWVVSKLEEFDSNKDVASKKKKKYDDRQGYQVPNDRPVD